MADAATISVTATMLPDEIAKTIDREYDWYTS